MLMDDGQRDRMNESQKMMSLLEDAAATQRTSGQTDVFVSMFVCSSDASS